MFNNLVNRQDLHFLVNGLRTGSIWRTLKRLAGCGKSAVETTWEQVEGPPSYFWNIPSVCRRALKPTGYLVASEFIGPTRFQWTDRQLEVINGVLAIMPPSYRRRWSNGRVKTRVHKPSRLSMMMGDPSEAAESARTVPLLEQHFEIVERRDYGGTIIHALFNDIAHNFLDNNGQEKNDEACRLIEMCFQIEDTLLELGDIQSDFALLVCKPPAS